MEMDTKQIFTETEKTQFSIRELLTKNELNALFPKVELPKDFNCKEMAYEIDIHNKNANAPRYDMKYKKQIDAENLASTAGLYENPFVLTQLYHRNNLILSPAKGKYLYDEHFPENQPEEQAYLVRKVSHLLPLFNENNEVQYLHFNVYARHVERGVYETYENYVVKYNEDGTMNHVIAFNKNKLNWIKLNYNASNTVTYVDCLNIYQYSEGSEKSKKNISCQYHRIELKEKS